MEKETRQLLLLFFLQVFLVASAANYHVKIGSECVNVVDKKFLSFTVDPKHLFSSVKVLNSEERTCMASFLTPAYLRIAGPSTARVAFRNSALTIDNVNEPQTKEPLPNLLGKYRKRLASKKLEITDKQWTQFAKWANKTGFKVVFALNNEEKSASGLWDPNSTLSLLSMAEKANIGNVVWQLGYECKNQSIDDYLNDLETLRLIVETMTSRQPLDWRIVGGDVTSCLGESKSDLKDYVSLTAGMTTALMLNGNSSYHELGRLSETDRLEMLRGLYSSRVALWLTEAPQKTHNKLERAADWLTSLGYSARNGLHVHFRELMKEELNEPSLSFYMALLFKNLVGERVLPVENMPGATRTALFAHCTSLRHQPVPGAVTLYGVNMDNEPARISLKLSNKEKGGEIMQFILKQDDEGNIIVNGREMSSEGDIRPKVKTVLPYKTLVINLPAKSFGFWVLANTNIEACYDDGKEKMTLADETNLDDVDNTKDRTKRFIKNSNLSNDLDIFDEINKFDNHIDVEDEEKIDTINTDLLNFNNRYKKKTTNNLKRQTFEKLRGPRKIRKQLNPKKGSKLGVTEKRPVLNFIRRILEKQKLLIKKRENDVVKVSRTRRNIKDSKDASISLTNDIESSSIENVVDSDASKNSETLKASNDILHHSKKKSDIQDDSSNFDDTVDKTKLSADGITAKIKSFFAKLQA